MRKMLLSFKPEIFEKIASGEKIFEHRKVFPDELILAYAYISRPVKAIGGIIYLENRETLDKMKIKCADDVDALERLEHCMIKNKYVMEIREFQETNYIELDEIRKYYPKFVIPQMYYYLDNTELLEFIESKLVPSGKSITHNFEHITSNMICRN